MNNMKHLLRKFRLKAGKLLLDKKILDNLPASQPASQPVFFFFGKMGRLGTTL